MRALMEINFRFDNQTFKADEKFLISSDVAKLKILSITIVSDVTNELKPENIQKVFAVFLIFRTTAK